MWDFETVYKDHVRSVFRYALRRVGRREWAEDITSETFVALYENRHTVDAAQLPAWLFKVAKNRAVDNWRKWSKEQSFEEETATVGVVEQAKLISIEHLLGNTSLKPVHRVCLVLRFVQGMSRTEIAKETGLTASQVKGHLQYALRILRKEMGGYRRCHAVGSIRDRKSIRRKRVVSGTGHSAQLSLTSARLNPALYPTVCEQISSATLRTATFAKPYCEICKR